MSNVTNIKKYNQTFEVCFKLEELLQKLQRTNFQANKQTKINDILVPCKYSYAVSKKLLLRHYKQTLQLYLRVVYV